MAVETTADLDSFFDTDDHGVAATITIGAGPAVAVDGIFDKAYFGPADDHGVAVEASRPVFKCREALVTGVDQGDPVVIADTTYAVTGVEADGTGVVLLLLQDQS